MTEQREFTTGAVISAATGKMCCDLDELYEILGWLVDDTLMTHQLPAASRAVEDDLKRQHPWVADLDTSVVDRDNVRAWYADVCETHGARISVHRPESVDWLQGNAIQDLQDIAGDRPIVAVAVDPDV